MIENNDVFLETRDNILRRSYNAQYEVEGKGCVTIKELALKEHLWTDEGVADVSETETTKYSMRGKAL